MDDLILQQLETGPMQNYVYVIGSRRTEECFLVDPAFDIDGLLARLIREGLTLTGVLLTHGHPDHVGGQIFGIVIKGLSDLLKRQPVPVHLNRHEAEMVAKGTGIPRSSLVEHEDGDIITVGDVQIRLLHTPGHTPGGQCLYIEKGSPTPAVITGDTLFIEGCGRVDLPGSDPCALYDSLTQRVATLPPETLVYPGHNYADRPNCPLGELKNRNPLLRAGSYAKWRLLMGV